MKYGGEGMSYLRDWWDDGVVGSSDKSVDGTRLNFIIRWAENLQTPNAMLCPQNLPDCTKRHTTCMIYTQVHSSNYLLACGQEFIVCSGNRWISSSS